MSLNYSIVDLENLTGIKAHTIRIWEQRYSLLKPSRTPANIRTYTDEDVRKILNVNTLRKEGWKISHISTMSDEEMESLVWDCARSGRSIDNVYDIYMQALVSASLVFDEPWFDSIFSEGKERFGLPVLVQHVIVPFLESIGLMWTVLKVHPGQEHFASNLVKRKMLSAIDQLPNLPRKSKYLLFLPPWEEHEIGLLYAWYLLKAAGYHVIYLGQRVPLEALKQSIDVTHPTSLLTFFITEQSHESVKLYIKSLIAYSPGLNLYAAQRDHMFDNSGMPSELKLLNSPQDLINIL